MGVYHLMGLGLSAGAVTGPLSYIARRYQGDGEADRAFFAGSGEREHRDEGRRVGDVQALVLFSSPEVIADRMSGRFVDNALGTPGDGSVQEGPVAQVLRRVLPEVWRPLAPGRADVPVYWCEVDRADFDGTFRRMARVVAALRGAGGQGKEMWANLTGGTNVLNTALLLAATLSGDVARTYYVQAPAGTEACLRCPREDGYWVELPLVPLAVAPLAEPVLDLLSLHGPLSAAQIHGRLAGLHAQLLAGMDAAAFARTHLTPLWKAQLVAYVSPARVPDAEKTYDVGPRWEAVLPYVHTLREARTSGQGLDDLVAEGWLTVERLPLAWVRRTARPVVRLLCTAR
jgi:hypothetical protein